MRLVCAPQDYAFPEDGSLNVVLYGDAGPPAENRSPRASAGKAALAAIMREKLEAAPRAWDLLSIALSIVTADVSAIRDESPDGWTREFHLTIAVVDPEFWTTQVPMFEAALGFLSTDRWQLQFIGNGLLPAPPKAPDRPTEQCVALLSGGLDSLVGAIDLAAKGQRPLTVSNIVRGDGDNQESFAHAVGAGGLRHLALNHNATPPWTRESSQRARSLIFMAFGILAATALDRYHAGGRVSMYVCENGFIALNAPLTGTRLGSLSTRTVHPEFINRMRLILHSADLRVDLSNPYEHKTKGKMLAECADQALLEKHASTSVSCGRYRRFNYRHCGRCVPCQVRRASFLAWGKRDATEYVYKHLGRNDGDHANFDDVRSVGMAIAEAKELGVNKWLGSALSYPMMGNVEPLRTLAANGLAELEKLHVEYGVR